jgi:hypothetical protein
MLTERWFIPVKAHACDKSAMLQAETLRLEHFASPAGRSKGARPPSA